MRPVRKTLSPYGKQTARLLLLQYALSLIVFPLICFALFLVAYSGYNAYRKISHDESSVIFWIAQILRDTLGLWAIIAVLLGWIALTYHFISKPLRYLDEVLNAAEALSSPGEAAISLSPSLKDVQDSLNLVREQALRSAMLAKEAEQRKNDLIVYLAHDLKTPLTSVIGYLMLLQEEPQISPELRSRYTGIALEKALRLEDLINEFFDITRFNLTSLSLEKEKIHLSRMLEQITSEFLPVLSAKELTWRRELQPDVELLCDPNKLERVFDNLIRNAVNYSYPRTEILLSMKREQKSCPPCPETDGQESVIITVSNHGRTIPPDKLERIFEQFFRLDSSRSSSTGGAGLGLAISKEIVEQHGGTISAASENERITFTVELPVRNS